MKRYLPGLLILSAVSTGLLFYLHNNLSEEAVYVTSTECRDCHQSNYDSWWNNTLHPHIFKPVASPDQILGDFEAGDPAVTFGKDEIEYVIGSRWEQVYARMIDGEYYPFPAKWYVQQELWEPYRVKDWKQTPMSYKCNGCHTTGFDAVTLGFAEFGIGCEACHGPGSLHVQNQIMKSKFKCSLCHRFDQEQPPAKDIIRSLSPAICGQCHNRGTNNNGSNGQVNKFNFPINFIPDHNIDQALNPSTPENDKKGKFWWGNGLSKNRHQEFSDWSKTKHAQSLKLLLQKSHQQPQRGELKAECLHCHSTDYRHAAKNEKPSLESAKYGVTCVACHEPHGHDKTRPAYGDGRKQCSGCHIDSLARITAETGKPHTPCPNGSTSCADCHMPHIVKTGGFFSLHSHAFTLVHPEASVGSELPNSCQNDGCHADQSTEWAIEAYDEHY